MKTLILLILFLPDLVWARVIEEHRIECMQEARILFDSDANPQLLIECATFDAGGQMVRPRREYNIVNRLSTAQKNGLIVILNNLRKFAADNEAVPAPENPEPTVTPK